MLLTCSHGETQNETQKMTTRNVMHLSQNVMHLNVALELT